MGKSQGKENASGRAKGVVVRAKAAEATQKNGVAKRLRDARTAGASAVIVGSKGVVGRLPRAKAVRASTLRDAVSTIGRIMYDNMDAEKR